MQSRPPMAGAGTRQPTIFVVGVFFLFCVAVAFAEYKPIGEKKTDVPVDTNAVVRIPSAKLDWSDFPTTPVQKSRLLRRLNSIIIPNINFEGAPLKVAFQYLLDEGKRIDPSGGDFNVLLQGNDAKLDAIQVTLDLKQVPLLHALRYLVKTAGLTYSVQGDFFVITNDLPPVLDAINPVAASQDVGAFGSRRALLEKLSSLTIKDLDLQDSTLAAAATFLTQQSRQLDSEKIGTNVLLIDPTGTIGNKMIQFQLRNVRLLQALRYIAEKTGAIIRVESAAVVIESQDPLGLDALLNTSFGTKDISAKLQTITLKGVQFEGMTITQTVNYLNEASRANDPAEIGVNFLFIGDPARATRALTFNIQTTTLAKLIESITTATGLRHRIDDAAVVFLGTPQEMAQQAEAPKP